MTTVCHDVDFGRNGRIPAHVRIRSLSLLICNIRRQYIQFLNNGGVVMFVRLAVATITPYMVRLRVQM